MVFVNSPDIATDADVNTETHLLHMYYRTSFVMVPIAGNSPKPTEILASMEESISIPTGPLLS